MSAMNVILQSNSVHLLTDALAYHPDGEIMMIGPKAVPMPHLDCAVAMRGPAGMRPIFAELIGNGAASFDELRSVIVELLQAGAHNYAPVFEDCRASADFEVLVAGISESTGPCSYMVASHDRYGCAWRVVTLAGVTCLPNELGLHEKIVASLPLDGDADAINPAVHGLRILQLQRAHLIANKGIDGEFCAVGGFAQLTTVTAGSVSSRVIHRWADRVGGKASA
ncbi:hypothetical protein [Tardiphaga robiniae]|uniref:hypothetical protein n=1 Tax=Tardiphaga robiniae TaxID=943830 RepID=UPI001585F41E|nr:hypothetical protein [Tardiphaga robiniae]NUU44548.1 hypothetical protein [Tardiphaga robiniae]